LNTEHQTLNLLNRRELVPVVIYFYWDAVSCQKP